ncbi:MAG: response regulator [Saprospiraceae bacterium]
MENASLQILLADDDEGDRFLFIEAVTGMEINAIIHTVNDGVQLMKHLVKEDGPLPNLIFLDLNMPRKNGFECLKEIRSHEKLKDIPIVIYSTSASEKDIDETFNNGANIYIKKPNDFNLLEQLLYKAIRNIEQYQEEPACKGTFLLKG